MSLRQAALVAGFAYLLDPVSYAEYSLYPKLVIPGNTEQTVQNIAAHGRIFVAIIFCYLICFIGDVVIAWALYILLAPVNRAVSLLAAWFQLVYAAIALSGLLNLVTVYRLLNTPDYLTAFGSAQLHAQVLLGCLIYRSGYIPWILGVILVINGLGWVTDSLSPYLFPNTNLGFISITFVGELFFMLWLLIRGWKIQEPTAHS